jgi:GH15 family glucan-1,4-alpha-glucosidase
MGRQEEAKTLLTRLLDLRNDVGLLAEEYDPERRCLLGNFPQAFSHVALLNTVLNLGRDGSPLEKRSDTKKKTPQTD